MMMLMIIIIVNGSNFWSSSSLVVVGSPLEATPVAAALVVVITGWVEGGGQGGKKGTISNVSLATALIYSWRPPPMNESRQHCVNKRTWSLYSVASVSQWVVLPRPCEWHRSHSPHCETLIWHDSLLWVITGWGWRYRILGNFDALSWVKSHLMWTWLILLSVIWAGAESVMCGADTRGDGAWTKFTVGSACALS